MIAEELVCVMSVLSFLALVEFLKLKVLLYL